MQKSMSDKILQEQIVKIMVLLQVETNLGQYKEKGLLYCNTHLI